jgi:hypothetical protein
MTSPRGRLKMNLLTTVFTSVRILTSNLRNSAIKNHFQKLSQIPLITLMRRRKMSHLKTIQRSSKEARRKTPPKMTHKR